MKKALSAVLVVIVVLVSVAVAYVWSGRYNVAATVPHWEITRRVIEQARDRSIAVHSRAIGFPPLDMEEGEAVEGGLRHYHPMCQLCHGAPGYVPRELAMGLLPPPPNLSSEPVQRRTDAQLFWIVKNGIKMTGMPSFGVTHGDEELWGIVALVRRLPGLQPEGYEAMVQAAGVHEEDHHHH